MKVALIQYDIVWQQHEVNLRRLEGILPEGADLIVLPEMFSCGFSMQTARVAMPHGGLVLEWMQGQAQRLRAVISGSVPVQIGAQQFVNRLYWVMPDGSSVYYDKRHLFRMGGEAEAYSPGKNRVVATAGAWRCLLQICYDLRFPVFSRNRNDYHIAVYVANWPDVRQKVWRNLLVARAIENQCYVLGVNRIGLADGLTYGGGTVVVDPKGEIVAEAKPGVEEVLWVELNFAELMRFRDRFPAWRDGDEFEIRD